MGRIHIDKLMAYQIFLFFFIIPKAWGLDTGDKVYVVMACAGLVFYVLALTGSSYSKRELFLIAFICISGFLSMIFSKKIVAFFPAIAISASKDTDTDKTVRFCMKCWILTVFTKFVLVLAGIIQDNTSRPEIKLFPGRYRHDLGYGHPNYACAMLLISLLYIVYVYWEKINWYHFLSVIAIFIACFFFTYSYTGTILAILLSLFLMVYKFNMKENSVCMGNNVFINGFLAAASFVPVIVSVVLLAVYDPNTGTNTVLDKFSSSRISLNSYYIRNYPPTLLGRTFIGKMGYEVIDNAFVYILLRFGIIAFLLYVTEYALLIYNAYRQGDTKLLLVICVFMAYGFMEMLIITPFMNFTLLFMGDIIWDKDSIKKSGYVSEKAIRLKNLRENEGYCA